MNRQTVLIVILGFIAIVRFVIVPLNEHRIELSDQYDAKYLRMGKGEALIAQSSRVSAELASVQQALSQFGDLFPRAEDRLQAQLNIQQRVSELASEREIKVEEVEWTRHEQGEPEQAGLLVEFSGGLKELMYFHTDLLSLGVWMEIVGMQYRVDKQKVRWKRLGETKGTMELRVYYLIEETK